MNAENMNQILDELATRFGATGAELWEQLVRHEGASHAFGLVVGVVVIAVCYSMFRWGYKQAEDENGYFYPDEPVTWLLVAAIMFSLFGCVTTILEAHGLAMWLIAPDAATLKGLLP